MTPTEKLLAEQEKIVAERGYYIRPVRMANLMKAASRIFDILTKADTAISYLRPLYTGQAHRFYCDAEPRR